MRLSLTFPPAFTLKEAPNGQRVAILPAAPGGAAGLPEAIVTFGALRIKPDEPRAWQEAVATGDLAAGTRAKLGRTLDHRTTDGWPVRLVEAEVLKASTDEVIEVRLCAFFTFLEHAGVAIVRTASRAQLETHTTLVLGVLESARPDWRGEPVCIAELWDLEPVQQARRVSTMPLDPAALAALAGRASAELTAQERAQRGALALGAGRVDEAIVELQGATALDPTVEAAHYLLGVALGEAGRHEAAIAAWERASALLPARVDTVYNIAQARFALGEFAAALRDFNTVTTLDPGDFLAVRKIVQCLHALGRFDEGQAARQLFRQRWATTPDPRARFITEYVFDQFDGGGFVVHAIETLRPPARGSYPVLAFRAFEPHGSHQHALGVAVLIETSEQAIAAGTPYVVGVETGTRFQVVAATAQLPGYPELKREVTRLLSDALKAAAVPTS